MVSVRLHEPTPYIFYGVGWLNTADTIVHVLYKNLGRASLLLQTARDLLSEEPTVAAAILLQKGKGATLLIYCSFQNFH